MVSRYQVDGTDFMLNAYLELLIDWVKTVGLDKPGGQNQKSPVTQSHIVDQRLQLTGQWKVRF